MELGLLIFLLTIGSFAIAQEAPSLEQRLVRATEIRLTISELERAFQGQRDEAISLLWQVYREERKFEGGTPYDVFILDLLLKFGHPPAMEDIAGRMFGEDYSRAMDRGRICEASGQVKLIPYLVPMLFLNEPTDIEDSGSADVVFETRRSIVATEVIAGILERSEMVAADVARWGDELFLFGDDSRAENREILRAWWIKNRGFFESGEYQKIRPGEPWKPPPPGFIASIDAVFSKEQKSSDGNAATNEPGVLGMERPIGLVSAAVPDVAQKPKAWLFWTGWIAGIAAFGAIIMHWRRRYLKLR